MAICLSTRKKDKVLFEKKGKESRSICDEGDVLTKRRV